MRNTPFSWHFSSSASSPLCRSQRRSAIVLLVPARRIMSGVPSSPRRETYRTDTPSTCSNASKSVKLEMRGNRITATSSRDSAAASRRESRSERLSSSSSSNGRYGTTPSTGIPVSSSSIVSPDFRISTSPRNLLMTIPRIRRRSASSSSMIVP